MATYLYIIRHGESLGNVNAICLGHTDLGLTEKGFMQADLTAKALSGIEFSKIYSSDLIRAYNTALPNAKLRNMEVNPTLELRELYFGDWENCAVSYLKEKFPDKFLGEWRGRFGDFQATNGESVPEMADRMEKFLLLAAKEGEGTNVLLASHAAAIRALWGRISSLEPSTLGTTLPFPTNASYSIIEYKDGKLVPLKYSCDEHLCEISSPLPG